MAIQYNFQIEKDCLHVKTTGKDESLEQVLAYSQALLAKALESNCTKVLCDERKLEYQLSVLETFQLAEKASELIPKVAQIAIVCHSKYLDDGKFYENVTSNRGLIVRVTNDYEDAANWLGLTNVGIAELQ